MSVAEITPVRIYAPRARRWAVGRPIRRPAPSMQTAAVHETACLVDEAPTRSHNCAGVVRNAGRQGSRPAWPSGGTAPWQRSGPCGRHVGQQERGIAVALAARCCAA